MLLAHSIAVPGRECIRFGRVGGAVLSAALDFPLSHPKGNKPFIVCQVSVYRPSHLILDITTHHGNKRKPFLIITRRQILTLVKLEAMIG